MTKSVTARSPLKPRFFLIHARGSCWRILTVRNAVYGLLRMHIGQCVQPLTEVFVTGLTVYLAACRTRLKDPGATRPGRRHRLL
jgi:hypothetical protein